MLNINDAKAAKTDYERFLVRHAIPRRYWKYGVEGVTFAPYKITRTLEGAKKGSVIREVSSEDQDGYWAGLNYLVTDWQPSKGDNHENNLIVFCSEDEKLAQYCMYTLIHRMLIQIKAHRSYKLETFRYYQLWRLLQIEDSIDVPNVVVIPSVVDEGSSNQYTSFRELFTSSFQIFCCTSLGPQAFFEKYHIVPGYMFYVDKILKMFDVNGLVNPR